MNIKQLFRVILYLVSMVVLQLQGENVKKECCLNNPFIHKGKSHEMGLDIQIQLIEAIKSKVIGILEMNSNGNAFCYLKDGQNCKIGEDIKISLGTQSQSRQTYNCKLLSIMGNKLFFDVEGASLSVLLDDGATKVVKKAVVGSGVIVSEDGYMIAAGDYIKDSRLLSMFINKIGCRIDPIEYNQDLDVSLLRVILYDHDVVIPCLPLSSELGHGDTLLLHEYEFNEVLSKKQVLKLENGIKSMVPCIEYRYGSVILTDKKEIAMLQAKKLVWAEELESFLHSHNINQTGLSRVRPLNAVVNILGE